jgi:hypothetical protein
LLGAAPYRDFSSNYPPGVFVLLAAVWKVIGVHAVVERWLALSFHLGIALLAGHLAGRIAGRRFVRKCRSTCASSPRRIARPRMPRKTWTSTIGQDEEEWILPAGFDVERDAVV